MSHHFKRARRQLKFLCPAHPIGRVIRRHPPQDRRHDALKVLFGPLLDLRARVATPSPLSPSSPKIYALHAPRSNASASAMRLRPTSCGCNVSPSHTGEACLPSQWRASSCPVMRACTAIPSTAYPRPGRRRDRDAYRRRDPPHPCRQWDRGHNHPTSSGSVSAASPPLTKTIRREMSAEPPSVPSPSAILKADIASAATTSRRDARPHQLFPRRPGNGGRNRGEDKLRKGDGLGKGGGGVEVKQGRLRRGEWEVVGRGHRENARGHGRSFRHWSVLLCVCWRGFLRA